MFHSVVETRCGVPNSSGNIIGSKKGVVVSFSFTIVSKNCVGIAEDSIVFAGNSVSRAINRVVVSSHVGVINFPSRVVPCQFFHHLKF